MFLPVNVAYYNTSEPNREAFKYPLLFNSVHAIIIEKIRDDYGLY